MKTSEINALSKEDLQAKVVECVAKLNELKLAHAVSPLSNPSQIKLLRRDIARMKTILTQKSK